MQDKNPHGGEVMMTLDPLQGSRRAADCFLANVEPDMKREN
jgi:hypothetical protein